MMTLEEQAERRGMHVEELRALIAHDKASANPASMREQRTEWLVPVNVSGTNRAERRRQARLDRKR